MEKLLLGIDIGTSACKVALFQKNGTVIGQVSEGYPIYYPENGWVEQNPEEWWQAICKAVKRVIAETDTDPKQIQGIGIDGQSWSCIPVDEKGVCLHNTPIWMDTRARRIANDVTNRIGFERIFEVSGNAFEPAYTTPKILWFKQERPEIYEKTSQFLQSNSYIAMRLTDTISQDISQGYGLHFFNMKTCSYDEQLAREMGISLDKIPDLYKSHEIIGQVTNKAAKETGLVEGTPVAAGGLDAACGTLGAGVFKPGQTQEQGGQAGGMSICQAEAKAHPKLILGAHVVPGLWLLQGGTVGGGGVLRWFRQEFGGDMDFSQLVELAEKIPAGSDGVTFLPYMAGERSPIWNPDAKGVFYGLGFDKSKEHMLRAALEGVAYSLEHNIRTALEIGVEVGELMAMGGAANSKLWTQIKADVTGKAIKVPASDTATTLGAAILAGVGTGMYESFEDAVKETIAISREHEPDMEAHKSYKEGMKLYLNLSRAMEGVFSSGSKI